MNEILAGLVLLLAGCLNRRLALPLGVLGLGFALAGSGESLLAQGAQDMTLPWPMPGAQLSLHLDPLSGFFLLPCALLGIATLIYARGYFPGDQPLWLNVMLACMIFVLLCRDPLAFLIAWEVMALSSFFLVTHDSERREVRRAGWIYLVATHLGTFFLMGFFAGQATGASPSILFLLALIGFGSKAGFVPVHVWLPEAHPVAPSPVSALMSGVLINMGLYGLVRSVQTLGPAPAWWGWTLLVIGLLTALGGVLFALAQRNLKQLLAYSSVENMGLVALGLGFGLLGYPLGYTAAALHVLSHSLLKCLLFLGAGAVLHETHTADIERLGGLLKRMPVTAVTFLIGSAGLAGLPPLNGFVTELLLLLTCFEAIQGSHVLAGVAGLVGLGLVAGLSLAVYSKAFGIVFLGEPRSERAEKARDPGPAMLIPMVVLALLAPVLTGLSPLFLTHQREALTHCLIFFAALLPLTGLLYGLRSSLLKDRTTRIEPTWDCGFQGATSRMEYTGLSFTQPLTDLFASLLHHRVRSGRVQGVFPAETAFSDSTPDILEDEVYRPLLSGAERLSAGLRRIQHGRVQAYILYILVTLVGLLAWGLT